MNFKTTLILLICLVAVGALLFLTGEKPGTPLELPAQSRKLLDWPADSVRRIVVDLQKAGTGLTLEKVDDGWRVAAPDPAGRADSFAVENLIRAIVDLESSGQLDEKSVSADTGLSPPLHTVEITDAAGATRKLLLGNRTSTGGQMYAMLSGEKSPHLVSDALLEEIEKSPSDFRDRKLIDLTSTQLRHIRITREGSTLELQKTGESWRLTQPASMPADSSEVSDITFALTGLRAEKFFGAADPRYELDTPAATIELSDQAPATQPSTAPATQPKSANIRIGRYVDISKKQVYADVNGSVVSLPASVIETIEKSPLDLRDKVVLEVKPEQVQSITLSDGEQTQTIQRARKPVPLIGPLPATQAATQATTQAATQPTTEPSTQPDAEHAPIWEFADAKDTKVDEAKLDELLRLLNPLRATKFLEDNPATQPTSRHTLTVTLAGDAPAKHVVELVEGGDHQTTGTHDGAIFELPHSILDAVLGLLGKSGHGDTAEKSE